jgi:hypothetical protein
MIRKLRMSREPHPQLRRLAPLVGTWRARGHTAASVLGPSEPVDITESHVWLDDGSFLVSTYRAVFGDKPAHHGLRYWAYDTQTRRLRNLWFSGHGPFTTGTNSYDEVASADKLTFQGPARFQYDLDDHGTVKLNPDGTHTVAWWLPDPDGTWTPWMTLTFTPASDPSETPWVAANPV